MSKPRERVTELERRVEELEATVDGLREELVEKAERIRLLEERLDADAESEAAADGGEEGGTAETPTSEDEQSEEEPAPGDDIIVA